MGNIFANKKPAQKREIEEDFVGGGGVLETDIYSGTIKYAYLSQSHRSEARALNICITIGKTDVTRQIWMTNGQGDVTYKDKNSGEMKNLPGYNQVNALARMLLSKEIGQLDMEDKTLKLYDYESKKEINQSVPCFEELHGVELQVAVQKQIVDKTQKQDDGSYEPTGETRMQNEFVKFFPESVPVTLSEIEAKIKSLGGDFDDVLADGDMSKAIGTMSEEDGVWAAKWLDKNRGETWDRSTGKTEGKSFNGGSKKSSGGGEKKSKPDLFAD